MGEGELGVEQALRKYPVINKLFVLFFRSILIIAEHCQHFEEEVNAAEAYDLLANYF